MNHTVVDRGRQVSCSPPQECYGVAVGLRSDAEAIWHAGVAAVEPAAAVQRWLDVHESSVARYERVWIVGVGKAAPGMALPLVPVLGRRLKGGLITTKDGHGVEVPGVEVIEAAHPIPDERSVVAAQRTMALVRERQKGELVLALISGGGSALWCLPAEGWTFDAVRQRNEHLLRRALDIHAVNAARVEMSAIKGGRLAEAARPAKVWSLVLSDVPGNAAFVASGPTYPGKRFDVVGDQRLALDGAAAEARRRGYVARWAYGFGSHAAVRGALLAQHAPGVAVLSGGEAELAVTGSGTGGRNQHLALDVAIRLAGVKRWAACIGGTDGTDGPTDAAGGLVDGKTEARIARAGLGAADRLAHFDSHRALAAAGDLLTTGPTGTNVMDLRVLLGS